MHTVHKQTIILSDQSFILEVHFKKGLKNINFKVPQPNEIRFSCRPRTSLTEIKKIIERHQKWLLQQNQKVAIHQNKKQPEYKNNELFIYLGKQFPLQIQFHQFKRSNLIFKNETFIASLCYDLSTQQQKRMLQTLFEKFYIRITKEICGAGIKILQLSEYKSVNSISIKKLKSRWGSCSVKGNLNFSHRLAQLPSQIQNYIIVHEYCHLFQMNHSPKFWNKVKQFCPNYAELRAKLRHFEKNITENIAL